jgi:hypothetical protein
VFIEVGVGCYRRWFCRLVLLSRKLNRRWKRSPSAALQCRSSNTQFLTAGAPVEFLLDEQSPVFVFSTGKSYFKAISLSTEASGRKLRVSSQPTGSIAFETGQYSQSFCPRVIFLDQQFGEIVAVEDVSRYSLGFWSSAFVSHFEIPSTARYAVLHTNPQRYGVPAFRYTTGGAYMVGGAMVIERGGEAIRHPCGPVANAAAELL